MPKVISSRKFRHVPSVHTKAAPPIPLKSSSLPERLLVNNNERNEASPKSSPITKSSLGATPAAVPPKVASDGPSSAVLSRGQKKRQMKREQYLRKEQMIWSSLRLRHQEVQSRRIDGLDAMKDALMNVEATTATTIVPDPSLTAQVSSRRRINTNTARQKLLQHEVAHMNLVLQHPRFVQDPLATIYEHLQNTFPASSSSSPATTTPPRVRGKKRKRHKTHYRATRSK